VSLRFLVCFLVLAIGLGAVRGAEPELWGALVYGSKGGKKISKELKEDAADLKEVFGYERFELLGQERRRVEGAEDRWLIPGRDFSLLLQATEIKKAGYTLALKLFQGKKLLVETEARVVEGSPLFIRGPLYRDGQLIIVLAVKRVE